MQSDDYNEGMFGFFQPQSRQHSGGQAAVDKVAFSEQNDAKEG